MFSHLIKFHMLRWIKLLHFSTYKKYSSWSRFLAGSIMVCSGRNYSTNLIAWNPIIFHVHNYLTASIWHFIDQILLFGNFFNVVRAIFFTTLFIPTVYGHLNWFSLLDLKDEKKKWFVNLICKKFELHSTKENRIWLAHSRLSNWKR